MDARPVQPPLARTPEFDFPFHREHDGSLSLESAVFQAIGAASVCWESMTGTGVFDDARARAIGEALLERIRVEGIVLRHCSWADCPGLEKSIPMHEQEDGPELHDLCKAAMIAPEAIRELTDLYRQLADERKAAS